LETKRTTTFATLLIALATCACSGKHEETAVKNEEAAPLPVSLVKMNDTAAGNQLLSGFYNIEGNAWRWTSGKFSVLLGVPAAAGQSGGTLTLNFTIPDVVIKHLPKITLTASVNGKPLGSDTYAKAGVGVFTADVPKELLTGESVKVDFALDKDLAPGTAGDSRELGIIANSVGLASR
jgi:hypothetical protein